MSPSTVRDNLKALSAYLYESSGPDFMFEAVEQAIALLGEREWLPIETAPKFAERFLICGTKPDATGKCVEVQEAWFAIPYEGGSARGWWQGAKSGVIVPEFVTHWMPLPEPPK